jgi:hypothetical protein
LTLLLHENLLISGLSGFGHRRARLLAGDRSHYDISERDECAGRGILRCATWRATFRRIGPDDGPSGGIAIS